MEGRDFATSEVSDVMGKFPQISETIVYGVIVPHSDGKAGCAAVVLVDGVTVEALGFKGLAAHLLGTLPRYAVPIFLRIVRALDYTSTMRLQRGKNKAEGVDPEKMRKPGDVVFWLPMGGTEYVKFKQTDWDTLGSRSLKL